LEDILFNAEEKGGLFLARAGLSSYLYRLCTTCVNLSMLGVVSTPSQYINIEERHRQSGRSPPCPSSTGLKTPFLLSGQCAPCNFVMLAALSISPRPLPPSLTPQHASQPPPPRIGHTLISKDVCELSAEFSEKLGKYYTLSSFYMLYTSFLGTASISKIGDVSNVDIFCTTASQIATRRQGKSLTALEISLGAESLRQSNST
jgi:hypothetical protein